jgi:hypothetical protein
MALRLQSKWDKEDEELREQREFAIALERGNMDVTRSNLEKLNAVQRAQDPDRGTVKATRHSQPAKAEPSSRKKPVESFTEALAVSPVKKSVDEKLVSSRESLEEALATLAKCRQEWLSLKTDIEEARGLPDGWQLDRRAIFMLEREAEMKEILERVEKTVSYRKNRVAKLEETVHNRDQMKCVSCMELKEDSLVAVLACKHAYCGDCIAGKYPLPS